MREKQGPTEAKPFQSGLIGNDPYHQFLQASNTIPIAIYRFAMCRCLVTGVCIQSFSVDSDHIAKRAYNLIFEEWSLKK
jgi:hypothetical protein